MTLPDPRLIASFRVVPKASALLVSLTGVLVLAGWLFGVEALEFAPANMVRMKANTAFSFILCGISLWLTATDGPEGGLIARALAGIALLLGVLTLLEYATGLDLRIDQLLASEAPGALKTSSPGRMAPNAALNFVLCGTALLLLNARRGDLLVSFLAVIAGSISLLALMGGEYATEYAPRFMTYTHIAPHTAFAFVVLSTGILFTPGERGILTVLASGGLDGRMARRLLPAVVVLPLLLGWFRDQGEHAGLFGDEFGHSLMVTASVAILAVVVWRSTETVARAEAGRLQALEALGLRAEELDRYRGRLEKLVGQRTSDLTIANEQLRAENAERHRAEEALQASLAEKEILLKELTHRTKNNMTMISNLIALQGAGIGDEQLRRSFADMQDRIRAMSLVHEKLFHSSDLSSVNMNEYLRDLVNSLLATHRGVDGPVRLNLEVDDLFFPIDATLPCGLIINELVLNSLKHAFFPDATGSIFLSFRRAGEGVELRYRDDGPGLPRGMDLAKLPSLGLKLVNNLAVRQLRGKMELRHDPVTEFVFNFGSFDYMEKPQAWS